MIDSLAVGMAAAGIDGYVTEHKGAFYVPVVMARQRGRGDCARWLDSLPRTVTIKFPAVLNGRLAGMLQRREFVVEREWAAEPFNEWVDVYVRRAA